MHKIYEIHLLQKRKCMESNHLTSSKNWHCKNIIEKNQFRNQLLRKYFQQSLIYIAKYCVHGGNIRNIRHYAQENNFSETIIFLNKFWVITTTLETTRISLNIECCAFFIHAVHCLVQLFSIYNILLYDVSDKLSLRFQLSEVTGILSVSN